MGITILYFEGCPNHRPVVEMTKRLVSEHGLDVQVEQIEVSPQETARLRFLGSPTVQVDGIDIEPAARDRSDFAISCRVYPTPDGLPSKEMLLAALGVADLAGGTSPTLSTTVVDRAQRSGMLAVGGSVASAILSSACCWLPLLLLTAGTSSAGLATFFERWRPLFIVVAIAMLGLGFYFGYFRKAACADECCARRRPRTRRIQRTTLWVSAVLVAAFIAFPNYVSALFDGGSAGTASAAADAPPNGKQWVFAIEGMHCEGCATTLRKTLAGLDGVTEVRVDSGAKTARITATDDRVPDRVVEATARVGFRATPGSEK